MNKFFLGLTVTQVTIVTGIFIFTAVGAFAAAYCFRKYNERKELKAHD